MQFTESPDRDRSTTSDSVQMDPKLIERIVADGGDIYTVVSKINDDDSSHSKKDQASSSALSELSSSFGSPKYSHLVHNKELQSKKPSRPPPPVRYSVINPSKSNGRGQHQGITGNTPVRYEDVSENKLVLTPASPPCSNNSEMWVSVKWQPKSRDSISSSQRSSSQTALDHLLAHQEYTNLDEIAKGNNPFVAQQRRRSFSEGESTIPISISKGSVIPIKSPRGVMVDCSLDSEDIYTVPPDGNDNNETYTVPPDALYGNVPMQADDYVNYDAEDYSHDYLNEEELREQLRNNPMLPMSEEIVPATVIQQKVPALGLKDMLMQNLGIKKPSTKTVIQSSAVSTNHHQESLPTFQFSERSGRGLQVGRGDYMEFSIDSWGSKTHETSHNHAEKHRIPPEHVPPKQSSSTAAVAVTKLQEGCTPISEGGKAAKKEPPPKPPLPAFLQHHSHGKCQF